MSAPRLVDHGVEAVLRRLELVVTRRLDGMLQGEHRGLLPGAGTEPGEARPYRPGDDVRLIDWNLTARAAEPHVRMPVADRELEAWIVADRSASVDFGTAACEKRDLVLAAAAAVGFLTAGSGNRVGAVIARGGGRTEQIPARGGRDHLLALLHRVATAASADGEGAEDLPGALVVADRLARRHGLVVVVSDFLGPRQWEGPLRRLAVRHDVLAVEVVDPRELELPDVGFLRLVDPETGRARDVQTASASLRDRYGEAAAAQRQEIASAVVRTGADHVVLRTDGDWLRDIVGFVGRRRRRAAVGARAGAQR